MQVLFALRFCLFWVEGIRDQTQVSVHSEQAIYLLHLLFEDSMLIFDAEFTLEKIIWSISHQHTKVSREFNLKSP